MVELSADVLLLASLALLAAFAEALLLDAELLVELLVLPLLADALFVAADDFTLLAVSALVDVEASVVEWLLFALFEAEDVFVVDALLLALALSEAFLLAVALSVELLVLALLNVWDRLCVAESLKDSFRVLELVLLLVTFDDLVSSRVEFAPRL